MKVRIPYSATLDPRDPDYVPFDFDKYEQELDEKADRKIEEKLLKKHEKQWTK